METDYSAVSPEHIKFLKDALYTHALQVEDFCRAECRRAQDAIASENHKAVTPLKSRKLVKQLEELIKTARTSENLLRSVNLEQLEARTERLQQLLEELPEDDCAEVA